MRTPEVPSERPLICIIFWAQSAFDPANLSWVVLTLLHVLLHGLLSFVAFLLTKLTQERLVCSVDNGVIIELGLAVKDLVADIFFSLLILHGLGAPPFSGSFLMPGHVVPECACL